MNFFFNSLFCEIGRCDFSYFHIIESTIDDLPICKILFKFYLSIIRFTTSIKNDSFCNSFLENYEELSKKMIENFISD